VCLQSPVLDLGASELFQSCSCGCSIPFGLPDPDRTSVPAFSGGGGPLNVATPGGGAQAGLIQSPAMFCASTLSAVASQAWTRPQGIVQVKSGCGALVTRGKPVELCTWFANIPDALVSGERIAGKKTMFGWQARLIQDTAGNVALYWGDRTAEAWKTTDGGSTFQTPAGNFGTLTRQGDGSFTRTTKDSTYYDFDSAGKLQKIKDRSSDGNVVYYTGRTSRTTPRDASVP
jgi:hypothetical protein